MIPITALRGFLFDESKNWVSIILLISLSIESSSVDISSRLKVKYWSDLEMQNSVFDSSPNSRVSKLYLNHRKPKDYVMM